jgi:hypothetical protein
VSVLWWLYNAVAWTWRNDAGYQIVSGPLSDLPILAGFAIFLHHRKCHEKGCPRLLWHPHPEHGHPVCRKHHPHGRGLPGR